MPCTERRTVSWPTRSPRCRRARERPAVGHCGVSERPSGATFAGREAELDLLGGMLAALDDTGARTVF